MVDICTTFAEFICLIFYQINLNRFALKFEFGKYQNESATGIHVFPITHLKPDILEYEVMWTLGRITTNNTQNVMESQLSYFKS